MRFNLTIPERFWLVRRRMKLEQSQLAALIGTSERSVAGVECGEGMYGDKRRRRVSKRRLRVLVGRLVILERKLAIDRRKKDPEIDWSRE